MTAKPRPRNVLFVVLDHWRADALGAAGNALIQTPHLDALAADAVLFRRHYAQCAPCGPARASLLTGMYQHNHGVKRNGTPMADGFTNVALEMGKVGYEPSLFGYTDITYDPRGRSPLDPALRSYESVLPGFEPVLPLTDVPLRWLAYLERRGYHFGADAQAVYRPARRQPGEGPTRAPAQFKAEHSITAFLTDELLQFISVRRDQSWFAHAAYIKPHPPFIASEPYDAMYDPAAMPAPQRMATSAAEAASHPLVGTALERARTVLSWRDGEGLAKDVSDADVAQLRATYYGMVSEVDAQLGRLIDQLKAWGLYDDTLIVVTSDHAEMLGDHWLLGKECPFEQAYHIPLIVRDPRPAADASRGTQVTRFTEAVDVMPTILQWVDADVPRQCDGRSLLDLVHGRVPAEWRDAAHWEYDFRDTWLPGAETMLGIPMDRCGMAALRTEDHLYLHFAALPPLLYDLRTDPGCLHNLANDPAQAAVMLQCAQRLLSWQLDSSPRVLTGMCASPNGMVVRDPVNAAARAARAAAAA
jgi:arylsulfatase A-like enzyme